MVDLAARRTELGRLDINPTRLEGDPGDAELRPGRRGLRRTGAGSTSRAATWATWRRSISPAASSKLAHDRSIRAAPITWPVARDGQTLFVAA